MITKCKKKGAPLTDLGAAVKHVVMTTACEADPAGAGGDRARLRAVRVACATAILGLGKV
eukprot:1934219-Pyramimonas_sp.AAC.3